MIRSSQYRSVYVPSRNSVTNRAVTNQAVTNQALYVSSAAIGATAVLHLVSAITHIIQDIAGTVDTIKADREKVS